MSQSLSVDDWLARLAADSGRGPLLLAFSGGLDSTFLLHALCRAGLAGRLRSVHVHHGLHPDAERWANHCLEQALALGVSHAQERVHLPPGGNLEARARTARYQALARQADAQTTVVLAHHKDDQAETVLQRLMRGAGAAGLSAMQVHQHSDGLALWRPLLDRPRAWIEDVARQWQLGWHEDPSNRDTRHDRNFLRHEVLPVLDQRWPAAERLAASATLLADTAIILAEVAAMDRCHCETGAGQLSLSALAQLSAPRRDNLLYHWLRDHAVEVSQALVAQLQREVVDAAPDRQPQRAVADKVLCRFRDTLYLLPADELAPVTAACEWSPGLTPVCHFGPWRLQGGAPPRDALELLWFDQAPAALTLKPASGGERLLWHGMHQQVSELWRAAGIPPWRRRQLPLVYCGDELVAAAAVGVADNCRGDAGSGWALSRTPLK